LIDLSRLILYAAVPALVVAGLMVTVVDAGTFPGSTLGVAHVTLAVGGAFAVRATAARASPGSRRRARAS
ncbi:hypothetical protein EXE45_19495, partial [Halorubrum sp. SP9]